MAFNKKTWVDRAVEFAGRRLLIAVSGLANGFDVSRSEGTVFVPGDEIDATNLNDLETRISDEFTLINNAVSGLEKTVLWTNPAPTSTFAGQTISNLSETIANFSEYEIIYELDTNPASVVAISTGRIKTSYKTGLNFASTTIATRFVTSPPSGTSITFGNGSLITLSTGASVTDNTRCIPLMIIGYK